MTGISLINNSSSKSLSSPLRSNSMIFELLSLLLLLLP